MKTFTKAARPDGILLAALVLGLACLWLGPPPAMAAKSFAFELRNEGREAISVIEFQPRADPVQTLDVGIPPGETGTVSRLEGGANLYAMRIVAGGDTYIFPYVYFGRDRSAAALSVDAFGIPTLRFYDDPKEEYAVSGNNSAWGGEAAIVGFPFIPGLTTWEQAIGLGAGKTEAPNLLQVTVPWEEFEWNVGLLFDGNEPGSVLQFALLRISMDNEDVAVRGDFGNKLSTMGSHIESQVILDKERKVDLTENEAKGEGPPKEYYDVLGEGAQHIRILYFPKALHEALVQIRKDFPDGQEPDKDFAAFISEYKNNFLISTDRDAAKKTLSITVSLLGTLLGEE